MTTAATQAAMKLRIPYPSLGSNIAIKVGREAPVSSLKPWYRSAAALITFLEKDTE
jgi:hypothetical protein